MIVQIMTKWCRSRLTKGISLGHYGMAGHVTRMRDDINCHPMLMDSNCILRMGNDSVLTLSIAFGE